MHVVYYDVTRLLSRAIYSHPTGIDRVDINYIYYFLQNDNYILIPVFQRNSHFYTLDKLDEFILELYEKWIFSKNTRFDFKNFISIAYKSKMQNSKILNASIKKKYISTVDGLLLDKFIKYKTLKGFYINASHHGVGNNCTSNVYEMFKILANAKIIFYLHDLIPIDFPEYVNDKDPITHSTRLKAMSNYADKVIVNSKYTESRFIDYCSENNLRIPETMILEIGVEECFINKVKNFNDSSINMSDNYYVYISTIEPRKNHIFLLHIWRSMLINGMKNIPKLIFIGKRGWNNDVVFNLIDRSKILSEYIIEMSDLSDDMMVSILKNSQGLLYPSFEEGWGMPIVEAIACNVPVICSNIPAHKESGQGVVKYLDPNDGIGWSKFILEAQVNPKLLNDIVENYKEYKFPTWKEHFEKFNYSVEKLMIQNSFPLLSNDEYLDFFNKKIKITMDMDNSQKTRQKEILLNKYSFINKIIIRMFFGNAKSDRAVRLLNKFKKDPIKFFMDSSNPIMKSFGNMLHDLEKVQ